MSPPRKKKPNSLLEGSGQSPTTMMETLTAGAANHAHGGTDNRKRKSNWYSESGLLMNVRDVIEEHARSVAAMNRSTRPNMFLEVDEKRKKRNKELEERGRQIAEKLNISVHSCCTRASRFYRSLTSEMPFR